MKLTERKMEKRKTLQQKIDSMALQSLALLESVKIQEEKED